MTSRNPVVSNALAARNADGDSPFFRQFQGIAKTSADEILYDAEGELRALTGKVKPIAEAARKRGDAKAVNDIARVLALLKDATKKFHSDCLRTIG